ncbi:hypothetical protein Tco_0474477 [Tanacetum coccineum]
MSDDSFTCNTSLEIFHEELNRMSIMDDDLFTYKVEITRLANIPCDLNDEDDSKQQITHGSDVDIKYDPSNIRGDDEVELADDESSDSDDEDEVAKIFRIDTNISLLKILMDSRLMKNIRMIGFMNEMKMCHGCSEWPTYSWRDDGYCNGGNFLGAYIVGNTLRYQDLEWYEALKDGKLKEETLKNKAIMEGIINKDDKLSNEGPRWKEIDNVDEVSTM